MNYALITLGFCLVWFFGCEEQDSSTSITEEAVIEALQNKDPALKAFPSDQLPPKSIKTEKAGDGWHVAFIQEGSGRSIISAKCYYVVGKDTSSNPIDFTSTNPEDELAKFSPKTCTISK